ncbi:antibiotic biosynthesis monooxygenase family protein [Gemmobacter nectariphilus]|uniref:antibiotic biosynthesis monooxygenase family protein n=1 Tax=Gemmobacter nectariphilus TaxID=220343 RepID=UPI000400FE2C|nr:antibiotic biosynthesis monooxygenase [Gemmobacter nectariphilus]
MFLTMNRFKVNPGQEAAFEAVWTGRDSQLPQVPGFVSFHLMKGPAKEGHTLYASHTLWESEAHFTAWTKSEAFRNAHRGAGSHGDLYAGPPELEMFSSVQVIDGKAAA